MLSDRCQSGGMREMRNFSRPFSRRDSRPAQGGRDSSGGHRDAALSGPAARNSGLQSCACGFRVTSSGTVPGAAPAAKTIARATSPAGILSSLRAA